MTEIFQRTQKVKDKFNHGCFVLKIMPRVQYVNHYFHNKNQVMLLKPKNEKKSSFQPLRLSTSEVTKG